MQVLLICWDESRHSLAPPVVQLLIDGKFVDAVSGKTFQTINPHDETVIMEVAEGDAADVDIAVKAARKAFDEGPWPKMTGAVRCVASHALSAILS